MPNGKTPSAAVAASAKTVPAVRRGGAILWRLAECGEPLGLSEIARATDMLPSTALHILRELTHAGLKPLNQIDWPGRGPKAELGS